MGGWGRESHLSISKNGKVGGETGLPFNWLAPVLIGHSSLHSNGWCLWVDTHLQEIQLTLSVSVSKHMLVPICGSHFGFVGLVIFVGTPSFWQYTGHHLWCGLFLPPILIKQLLCAKHFARPWGYNTKSQNLLPPFSIFSHVFVVEIWETL